MAQEINTSSVSLDHPPTYAEAMECVQLSPTQLAQVMENQQWNIIQNNYATAANDPEDAFDKEKRKKKNNIIGQWYLQLSVFIFLTFVVIWIACLL